MKRQYLSCLQHFLSRSALLSFCILSLSSSVQAQIPITQPSPSSNSRSAVPESPLGQAISPLDNDKNVDLQEKLLDRAIDYNKNLLDTVFLSLIGTVATISLTIFGLNYFEKILTREQEREILQGKLEKLLDERLNEIQQNLWALTDAQLNSIEIRLKWIEYKLNVLSAEQLEREGYFQCPTAIQERFRAIQTLQKLKDDYQGSAVITCLEGELQSVEELLSEFKDKSTQFYSDPVVQRINVLPILTQEDFKLAQEIIKPLESEYQDEVKRIKSCFEELITLYKTSN